MLKLQKSSLVLILIIVVLTAGCVSIYTLGYTPGTVWHKAEDVKSGTFGASVNTTNKNYVFPANLEVGSGQVTAGSGFVTGGSSLTGTALTVASGGTSSIGGNLNITGNVGIGTTGYTNAKLSVNGEVTAALGVNGQFRAVSGNYGIMFRNDGSNSYLLLTNSGDQYGSWNSLRPFYISNTTGNVTLGNGALFVTHGGNVGVGTTSPGSYKLNVNGTVNATNFYKNGVEFSGGACQLNGNDIICSGIPNNTAGTLSITKNGVTCPIWKDCDGDGKTYGNGDCDESCLTCYVGSAYYTDSPDGKDNDCNGIVDNYLSPATLSCAGFPYLVVPGSSCEKVTDDAYCTSVCQNNGWGKGTATCFNTWGCCNDTCATCYGATFGMGSVSCNDGRHRVSCYCASGYR